MNRVWADILDGGTGTSRGAGREVWNSWFIRDLRWSLRPEQGRSGSDERAGWGAGRGRRVMAGFRCPGKMLGLYPEDCRGAVEEFETGMESLSVCDIKGSGSSLRNRLAGWRQVVWRQKRHS